MPAGEGRAGQVVRRPERYLGEALCSMGFGDRHGAAVAAKAIFIGTMCKERFLNEIESNAMGLCYTC